MYENIINLMNQEVVFMKISLGLMIIGIIEFAVLELLLEKLRDLKEAKEWKLIIIRRLKGGLK